MFSCFVLIFDPCQCFGNPELVPVLPHFLQAILTLRCYSALFTMFLTKGKILERLKKVTQT